MVKTVLVVTPYFPPVGGGGVQRITKFVRYLRDFDWNPIVLTIDQPAYSTFDPSLVSELPTDLPIYRVKAIQPTAFYFTLKRSRRLQATEITPTVTSPNLLRHNIYRMRTIGRRFFQLVLVPDDKVGWVPYARHAALKIIQKQHIDLIFTTCPPYSANMVGAYLTRRTGIPWVADFRDPFLGSDLVPIPTLLHHRFFQDLERHWVQHAARVVSVSPVMTRNFTERYPEIDRDKWVTVLNGYDEEDFNLIDIEPSQNLFLIRHIGTMYANASPDPDAFFRAIYELANADPDVKRFLRVEFIGAADAAWMGAARSGILKYGLQDMILLRDPVSHMEAVQAMLDSSILLMMLGEKSGSEFAIRAKMFEYLRAHRMILALAPKDGAMFDLLHSMDGVHFESPNDSSAIASTLKTWFTMWKQGTLPHPENIGHEMFGRRLLTKKLAQVFDEVVSEKGRNST